MTDFPLDRLLGKSLKDDLMVTFFKSYEDQFKMEPDDEKLIVDVARRGFDLELDLATNQIYVVHYYSGYYFKKFGPVKGAVQFAGNLPAGLEFKMHPEAVVAKLGEPIATGGGMKDAIFGIIPRWMKFHDNSNILHLTFADDYKSISLVSLTLPEFDVGSH